MLSGIVWTLIWRQTVEIVLVSNEMSFGSVLVLLHVYMLPSHVSSPYCVSVGNIHTIVPRYMIDTEIHLTERERSASGSGTVRMHSEGRHEGPREETVCVVCLWMCVCVCRVGHRYTTPAWRVILSVHVPWWS